MHPASHPGSDPTLAEQARYYDAIAPVYEKCAISGAWGGDVAEALERFGPSGEVLELACGPGTWTEQLTRHATRLTAVDGSATMLARARARVGTRPVRFIQADLFSWEPDRRYDVVFFGFWLSHVPDARFDEFWALVARCLQPGGRVFFVDDAHRTPDELVYGDASEVVRRRLPGGDAFDVVKVPRDPAGLERRLSSLGWRVSVTPASPPFFWGEGTRA